MCSSDLDILNFSFFFVYENKQRKYIENIEYYNHITNGIIFQKKNQFYKSVWHCIYKKDFIINYNLFFVEKIYFEDEEFILRLLFFAKRIMSIPDRLYYYYQLNSSIIHHNNPIKKIESLLTVSECMHRFIDKNINEKHALYKDYKNWEACIYSLALDHSTHLSIKKFFRYKSHISYPLKYYNKRGLRRLKYIFINTSPNTYILTKKLMSVINYYKSKITASNNNFNIMSKLSTKKIPSISIIIPVYNVEKYLSQCINSIINQTIKDIEIILINDASSDKSLSICNSFKENDKRIIVIDKPKNEGVDKARFTGLGVATGEYLTFVDADDWLDKITLEEMYKSAIEYNADVVEIGLEKVMDKFGIIRRRNPKIGRAQV